VVETVPAWNLVISRDFARTIGGVSAAANQHRHMESYLPSLVPFSDTGSMTQGYQIANIANQKRKKG
jgi:hypothetical protein